MRVIGVWLFVKGQYPANWREQLKMPLLQRAVASIYGRTVEEIEMGVVEQHTSASSRTRIYLYQRRGI
jgi:hypothetical protein